MPALLLSACAADAEPLATRDFAAVDHSRLPVIYGKDDRREVFEHPDVAVRDIVKNALVALVPKQNLSLEDDAAISLISASLADSQGLCASERFLEQPTAADCSGVLIAEDLVLTAAHCFADDVACQQYAYVFDYFYAEAARLEAIDADDVADCAEIVVRRLSEPSAPLREDFAVVRLSQPVLSGRMPLTLRRGPMHLSEPATVVGFPSGLPAKIDDGAVVRSPRAAFGDYFALDADTFHGSSGSPVLDAQHRLAGIVVRGGIDYVDAADAGCAVSRTVDGDARAEWEHATYVTGVLEALCEDPKRAPTVCKSEPACGDGVCERVEANNCPADCLDMCSLSLCKPNQESTDRRRFAWSAADEAVEPAPSAVSTSASQGCSASRQRAERDATWLWIVFALASVGARVRRFTS
jgi:hypothetical protein